MYLLTYLHVSNTANSVVTMELCDLDIPFGYHYLNFKTYLLIIPVWDYPVFYIQVMVARRKGSVRGGVEGRILPDPGEGTSSRALAGARCSVVSEWQNFELF